MENKTLAKNSLTAYTNGLYHSNKHGRTFTAENVGKAIGMNGLNFVIVDKKTKQDETKKHIVTILGKVLIKLAKNNEIVKACHIQKECLNILKKLEEV